MLMAQFLTSSPDRISAQPSSLSSQDPHLRSDAPDEQQDLSDHLSPNSNAVPQGSRSVRSIPGHHSRCRARSAIPLQSISKWQAHSYPSRATDLGHCPALEHHLSQHLAYSPGPSARQGKYYRSRLESYAALLAHPIEDITFYLEGRRHGLNRRKLG